MRVVVRHDQPIAAALEGTRPDLTVVGTDAVAATKAALGDADAFVINPANWTDAYLDALGPGTWVQATSTGYAAFPLDAFAEREVVFTTARGNYGPPVADHAMALLLALARNLPGCLARQRVHEWDRGLGDDLLDLAGRRLTVVGLGDVGDAIAQRARGFDMTVAGTKRDPDGYEGVLPADRVHPPGALSDLVPRTDVLVLAVPLTDATRGLVDADLLAALPERALLINLARGPVVDEGALVAALDNDEIAGAGLDVFVEEPLPPDAPLWDRPDVLVTPHIAGRSRAFVDRFVELFLENYDRRRSGDPLRNRVV